METSALFVALLISDIKWRKEAPLCAIFASIKRKFLLH